MSILTVLLIGAVLGAVGGAALVVGSPQPARTELFVAVVLKGVLVSLLTAYTLVPQSPWWHGLGIGAFYGIVVAAMLALVRRAVRHTDRMKLFPEGILTGAVIGSLLVLFSYEL